METRESIDLAGRWRFALDRENKGIRERWFAGDLADAIHLPGSTDEAHKGDFIDERCEDRLSRVWRWIGPAWYQKRVTIPNAWADKKVWLYLERTKDSQVWVDGTWAGSDDSLSTPHVFDLTPALTPGEHTITVLVDNAKLPPVGPCHQVDERTQTNWNGIVGRLALIATDKIWIDDLQAYPQPETGTLRLALEIANQSAWQGVVHLTFDVRVAGGGDPLPVQPRRLEVELAGRVTRVACDLALPDPIPLWDEFEPTLLRLAVEAEARCESRVLRDARSATIGMRAFCAQRGQFAIHGRPTFLRGKCDSALFPLTGYAPMDVEEWARLLSISQSYGFNHYRFHSWCPPEAAFAAADRLGIYFQVELPNKREITAPDHGDYRPPAEAYETLDELQGEGGPPAARTAYLLREGERILRAYGNHPSFVMLSLGNELGGDVDVMRSMLDHFRALDPRHLYAMGTGHFHWDIRYRAGDEFWVTRGTGDGYPVRGASWEAALHVDHRPPSTTVDYSASLHGAPVPVIGHEIGSYEVYPDYREIERYTGVLKARNLEAFRERLREAGMLDQAQRFLEASGQLSLLCHREEVEAALRTPGLGGFQMLDLQDFSGQGTALVGMLNVLMESKGLVTPEAWREFCCETVPLLWMHKYTWTSDETFRARVRLAHYGPADLQQQSVTWELTAGDQTVAAGQTAAVDVPTGTVTEVDLICAGLGAIETACKLVLTLTVTGTRFRNRYPLWVYPAHVEAAPPDGLRVARSFTEPVRAALAEGARVLLLPRPGEMQRTVAIAFQTGFWSPMFRRPDRPSPLGGETPGTQGLLCDPDHPLFRGFPTEFHANWQWWRLVKNASPMILDATPHAYRPLLQVIDGFDRNHKLGLIVEARVGPGRLLICSIDLPALQQQPEARQLLAGIYRYMDSTEFDPQDEWTVETVQAMIG